MSTSSDDHDSIFRNLGSPLPSDALEIVPGEDFCSIKQAYVIERLNDVLKPNNWKAKYIELSNRLNAANEISLKCILESAKYELYAEGYGSNEDQYSIGNAYKGARSTALKNAVLSWGVGLDIHKGVTNEGYSINDIPTVERIKKSSNSKFIWTTVSGIITESQEDDKFLWLQINGWTCRAMGEIREDLEGKEGWKATLQGYWSYADSVRFVHLSKLTSIMELEPLIVPKLKKNKSAEETQEVTK